MNNQKSWRVRQLEAINKIANGLVLTANERNSLEEQIIDLIRYAYKRGNSDGIKWAHEQHKKAIQ